MTYNGIVKGRVIELNEPLPYGHGEAVVVSICPAAEESIPGSPRAVLEAIRRLPKLAPGDVDELERVITEAELPVRSEDIFGPSPQ